MNRITSGIFLACLTLWCSNTTTHAESTGKTGHSGKDPKLDCSACHGGGASDPQVTVSGPVTVDIDSAVTYTLNVHGAPGSVGGFNVAASAGTLGTAEKKTRIVNGELTQRSNQVADDAGTVRLKFRWRAPDTPGTYTLFVAGVLGNADGQPTGDSVLRTDMKINVIDRSAATNESPLAHLQLPPAALVGEKIIFTATQSKDADGEIVSYEWEFGDGEKKTGRNPTMEYQYKAPGVYSPQLTVTDDGGSISSAMAQIEITATDGNARPKAMPGGPYEVAFGDPVQFDGGQSRAGHKEGQIVSYEWDFGDGFQGNGATPTHVYAKVGNYLATLTVWDDRGLPNSAMAQVRIQEGATARFTRLKIPSKLAVWEGEAVPYTFEVVASMAGLRDGTIRCGVAYLDRNGEAYRNRSFCLTGAEEKKVTFEHVFSGKDAPSVEWTAYLVFENGSQSQNRKIVTQLIVFPVR